MIEDAELLRRYADEKSEEAFAALVQRHLALVYSVALRQVAGDAHLAEDVTQQVFVALARKAAALADRPVLSGWLYRSAHYAASDVVRVERRRRAREQETLAMNALTTDSTPPADWDKVRPALDAAIAELDERDRDAVALRFFDGRSFADVGDKLRLTENAARMRVERALDKLHAALARRGVGSTAAALGVALANQASIAAPVGLAASVTGAALAGGSVAATVGAMGTLLTLMSTGKIMLGLAGIAAAVALGTAFTAAARGRDAEVSLNAAGGRQATLDARVADLEKRLRVGEQRVQTAEAENARLLRSAAEQKAAGAAAAAEEEPVTSDVVQARMNRARQLVQSGDHPAALKEIIWLFDVGMKRASGMGPVRLSFGVSLFAELAGKYPPARVALDERREAARQKMMADAGNFDAVSEYGAITRVLKDSAGAIALLEQFPPGDRRRAELARAALDDLVESRRYALALEGWKFSSMLSLFESMSRERPGAAAQTEDVRRMQRESVIKSAVRDVEMLAGAGEVANARTMASRLLAYDNSEGTQALLQQHLVRAGQPNLLLSPNP